MLRPDDYEKIGNETLLQGEPIEGLLGEMGIIKVTDDNRHTITNIYPPTLKAEQYTDAQRTQAQLSLLFSDDLTDVTIAIDGHFEDVDPYFPDESGQPKRYLEINRDPSEKIQFFSIIIRRLQEVLPQLQSTQLQIPRAATKARIFIIEILSILDPEMIGQVAEAQNLKGGNLLEMVMAEPRCHERGAVFAHALELLSQEQKRVALGINFRYLQAYTAQACSQLDMKDDPSDPLTGLERLRQEIGRMDIDQRLVSIIMS